MGEIVLWPEDWSMNTRDKMLKKASKMIPEESIIRSYIEPYEGSVKSIENPDKAFGY